MSLRDLFPGYYLPTEDQFRALWAEGVIVLDTSVLLNLYKFPRPARDDMLAVLAGVKPRIWLPHHVALESNRGREKVISNQLDAFDKVRQILGMSQIRSRLDALQLRKFHSLISVDGILAEIEPIVERFEKELANLEEKHVKPTGVDPVRDAIIDLVEGNVGKPFDSPTLEALYQEGEARYELRVPPGFGDAKEKSKLPDFVEGGVKYRPKFGDLIIWKQILRHAREANVREVMLVSDDEKGDWRKVSEYKGNRSLTPHPELVDEIRREAQVDVFYIYSSEQFLRYGMEQLGVAISDATIPQVTDVKEAARATLASEDVVSFIQILGEEGNRRDALLLCGYCNAGIPLHFYEGDGSPKLCEVLGLFHYWDCPGFEGRSSVRIVILRSNGASDEVTCGVGK